MSEIMFNDGPVQSNRIIYTPTDFARHNLFHLQEAGELQATKPHTNKREGLSSFLCFIVINGSGTLVYDGVTYTLKRGDCAFIDCMHPYAHAPSPTDLWSLQWIHFFGSTMPYIYTKYTDRGGRPVFTPSDQSSFSEIMSDMLSIAGSDDYIRDMKLNEKIASLLTLIMSESWHPDNSRIGTKRQSLQAIKTYLDDHYTEKISLDFLSKHFFINKYYLTRVFREQYGITILSYLDHVRVSHAKHLLRFSELTLENIGRTVGIDEPGYFSRLFKKVEGITPGEYRKKW